MRRRSFTEKSSEMKKMPAAWGDVRTSKVYLTSKCPDSFTLNWHPSWEPLCVLWSSLFVHVHEVWPTLYMGSALNILYVIGFGQVDNLLFTDPRCSLSLDRTPKGTRRGLICAECCCIPALLCTLFTSTLWSSFLQDLLSDHVSVWKLHHIIAMRHYNMVQCRPAARLRLWGVAP